MIVEVGIFSTTSLYVCRNSSNEYGNKDNQLTSTITTPRIADILETQVPKTTSRQAMRMGRPWHPASTRAEYSMHQSRGGATTPESGALMRPRNEPSCKKFITSEMITFDGDKILVRPTCRMEPTR